MQQYRRPQKRVPEWSWQLARLRKQVVKHLAGKSVFRRLKIQDEDKHPRTALSSGHELQEVPWLPCPFNVGCRR